MDDLNETAAAVLAVLCEMDVFKLEKLVHKAPNHGACSIAAPAQPT